MSLGIFVDSLNTFSVPGRLSIVEIKYPGPDMQLLLKYLLSSLLHHVLNLLLDSMFGFVLAEKIKYIKLSTILMLI